MDWNAIKVFLAIVKTGSLSGAAKELDVNHSTIFRRLNTFEKELGGRIFERAGNHYNTTPLGDELLAHAEKIEHIYNSIERHVIGKEHQPKGIIKLTAPNNIAYRYLPRYIHEFNQQYPDINIEIIVSNLAFNMSARDADIAVRATPSPPEHLVGRQVCSLPWSIYGSPAYIAKHSIPNNSADLQNYNLIGATGDMRGLPAFKWLDSKYNDQIKIRCNDLTAMSCCAESGQGLAILPEDQSRPELTKLLTLPNIEPSYLWLLTHPDLRSTGRIKLLMKHLSEAFSAQWP